MYMYVLCIYVYRYVYMYAGKVSVLIRKSTDSPNYLARQKELFSVTGPYWQTQLSTNLLIISPEGRNKSNFLYPVFICEQKIVDKYQK